MFSLRLFELFPEHPILAVNRAIELLDSSRPAASEAVWLEAAGIVRSKGERKKNRTVVFEEGNVSTIEGPTAPRRAPRPRRN